MTTRVLYIVPSDATARREWCDDHGRSQYGGRSDSLGIVVHVCGDPDTAHLEGPPWSAVHLVDMTADDPRIGDAERAVLGGVGVAEGARWRSLRSPFFDAPSPATAPRSIRQIAVGGGGELYALCEDGSLWQRKHRPEEWVRVRDVPGDPQTGEKTS